MVDPEIQLDFLEQQIPSLAAAATKIAYWKALSSGQSVLEAKDGFLCERHPDGSRVVLKELDKSLSIQPGTRFEIP